MFSVESRTAFRVLAAYAGAVAFIGMTASVAQAHRRDFVFNYDWKQPSKGELELESQTAYERAGNVLEQGFSLEYGISDRWAIEPYVVFERENGESLDFHEWKVETRYQLTKYKTGKILPALYLEYANEREDGEHIGELEGKLILSRYGRNGDDITFNFTLERELEDGAQTEKEYSLGYARPLGKNGARIGAEFIHNLTDDALHLGPTVGFAPSDNIWLVAGYAHPLNKRDENKGEFRLNVEYEF